jgi:hypothetical protein
MQSGKYELDRDGNEVYRPSKQSLIMGVSTKGRGMVEEERQLTQAQRDKQAAHRAFIEKKQSERSLERPATVKKKKKKRKGKKGGEGLPPDEIEWEGEGEGEGGMSAFWASPTNRRLQGVLPPSNLTMPPPPLKTVQELEKWVNMSESLDVLDEDEREAIVNEYLMLVDRICQYGRASEASAEKTAG